MNDQLMTLNDEALDQVAGGATIDVSLSFPTPLTLLGKALDAIGGVFGAIVSGIRSIRGLFGIDVSVSR